MNLILIPVVYFLGFYYCFIQTLGLFPRPFDDKMEAFSATMICGLMSLLWIFFLPMALVAKQLKIKDN